MGNITKRGSKGRAADGPKALEGSTAATLHVQLCEAIMRQDCAALRALLRSHPVNQPMTILTSSTGCSLANSRLFLSQVLASPARSLSALSMPQARQCAPSCVLPSLRIQYLGWKDPLEEGRQPIPGFLLGEPMDRGVWWAMVHRVT